MTRIIVYLLLVSVVSFSCSKKEKVTKIGFLFSTQATARYVKEANFFKERAEQLGATVFVDDGNDNEALQYEKAMEMFDKKIDVLVLIAINTNTAAAIVRESQSRNIPVIAYNRLIKNCEPNLFIAANNDLIGQHMCREVLKKTQTGNVVILAGDKYDRNAVELQDAIDKEIAPLVKSGQLKVLYKTFIEEWSDHNATYEFEQFLSLSGEKPDIVFAGYDGIAESVIHMLERNNLMEDVYITGQDAELRAVKNIIDGKQVMTVFHPLKEIAYQVAELAVDLGNDKMPDKSELSYINNGLFDVPTIKMNSKAVTIENIDEVLIKSGTYTKEEVYN